MIRQANGRVRGGLGCGCGCGARRSGLGGIFSTVLDVAGSFVGDPGLGNQVASQAQPGFGPITQNSQQIATTVEPAVAAALAQQGVMLPAGTVGAQLQSPTVLNAFGGSNAEWLAVGALGLGALLLLKEL